MLKRQAARTQQDPAETLGEFQKGANMHGESPFKEKSRLEVTLRVPGTESEPGVAGN
jgi:hypothetical protein